MISERVDPAGDSEFEDANPRPDPKMPERHDDLGDLVRDNDEDESDDEG